MDIWRKLGQRCTPQEQRLLDTLLFVLRFLLVLVPLLTAISFLDLTAIQVTVASQAAWLLEQLGLETDQISASVFIDGEQPSSFFISPDSTGWKSLLLFFSLVIATGSVTLRQRLVPLIIGLPLLWLGNLVRVASVVLIHQQQGFAAADLAHDVYWPIGIIFLVATIWLVWLWQVRRIEARPPLMAQPDSSSPHAGRELSQRKRTPR